MVSRRWRDKLAEALRGAAAGIRTEANFRIHVPAALLVVAAAAALGCNQLEWALLALCVGLVFTAELLNTAVERLFHALDDGTKARVRGCLDVAAGGGLAAAGTAGVVGGNVVGTR